MKRLFIFAACVLLSAPGAGHAADPVALPGTPPAQRLLELLERINAGDRAALVAYARNGFVPAMLKPDEDSIVDFLYAQYEVAGGYDLRRVMQSAAEQITVLVQGRRNTQVWRRLVVGTEKSPPHRVQGIFTQEASAALAQADDAPLGEAELPQHLESLIARVAEAGGFSGSVCLARGGRVLMSRGYGEADREARRPNTPATRFGVASVGKMFTAVAIAKLVEAGRLSFDDRAAAIVPEWLPPGADSITVAHLLTHTSGLGDFLGALAGGGRRYDDLSDYRALARREPPAFAAGSSFRYSNVGYLVLGAIIEKKAGMAWDAWIEANVMRPAGMTRSSAKRPAAPGADMAIGYHETDDAWERADATLEGRGSPAGAAVSTAEDLARFAQALHAGRLVSPAMLDRLKTPHTPMPGTGKSYGYGLTVAGQEPGRRVYGHEGGFHGIGAMVEIYESGGWVLTALSNTTGGAAPIGDLWRDLRMRVAARTE